MTSVASSTFTGFRPEAVQFLADLAANNDRAWFQPRKEEYERLLKEPMELLCHALAERFAARGIPLRADPKRSPFRIYRDTRFSRDKSPYKTHLSARFPYEDDPESATQASEGPHGSGAYFHFQPGEMFAGGGMWMPEKPRLDAFRRAIVEEPDRVAAVLDDPAFVVTYGGARSEETLRRVPAGYPADHPMADRLRWKSVVFGRPLSDQEVFSPNLPDQLASEYQVAVPVFAFLASLG
jgi:uncharacterized protein (TIGR02453 family)